MKRDPIWLALLLASLVTVGACALLGGPVKSPIVVDCHDGTPCPNGYAYPPLSSPGGRCEADIGTVQDWGERARDAGRR